MQDPHAPVPSTRAQPISPTLTRAAHVRLVARHGANRPARQLPELPTERVGGEQRQVVLRGISRKLLASAGGTADSTPDDVFARAEDVLVVLGSRFIGLVGVDGYRALVGRAVKLAAAENPLLEQVGPASWPPGGLIGLPRPGSAARSTSTEVRKCAVAMLAALLQLLDEFIGLDLTAGVLGDLWPKFAEVALSQLDDRQPREPE